MLDRSFLAEVALERFVLSVLVASALDSTFWPGRWAAKAHVELFRGTQLSGGRC
jgi:hypothetical protein